MSLTPQRYKKVAHRDKVPYRKRNTKHEKEVHVYLELPRVLDRQWAFCYSSARTSSSRGMARMAPFRVVTM